ncbi:hypothetical protein Tco_0576744 [Tanacetum coccineum]
MVLLSMEEKVQFLYLEDSYLLVEFNLSDTLLYLADKSDSVFEKFDDELAHIISPPKYDCFYFDIEPDPGELTRVVVEDIFGEPRVHMPNCSPPIPLCHNPDYHSFY